ncbi:MAG: lipopolysaccharide kinase InaA family protein, partial [Verrucomicrobiota bacterium]
FHSDLHISNLLYSPEKNELCLVDLDNMKILPGLSREQRMDNLATLNRRWPLTAEFFENYDAQFQEFVGMIAQIAERKHRESIPKKLKILFGDRALFVPKKLGGMTWQVRSNLWSQDLESVLNQPDDFLATRARLLKKGTRSTVGCADGLVLKRFNFKKVSTVVFDLFRPSRARRGFRTARHLELLKIATPRPIAYADQRRFGLIVRGYFVMEEVRGAAYPWQRLVLRKDHIRSLAELLAKVHNEGFSHRDLKETNILLDSQDTPYLIDLDALHYLGKISNRRASVEMARLARGFARRVYISKTERLRFLKQYCLIRKIDGWRWWWNQVGENLALPRKAK